MRAFRISLVLFLIMACMIVCSMVMNRHVSGSLRSMVAALPEHPQAGRTGALAAFWHRWRAWIRPTMNQTTWRAVNDTVGDLAAYGELGEEAVAEYVGTKSRLLGAIEEMSRPERLGLQCLF